MKTTAPTDFGTRFWCLFAFLIFAGSPWMLRAQLVADGQTAVLDGVASNILDNVTVGTNGSFTLLVATNGSAISNSGTVSIGLNISAAHNQLMVAGASTWTNSGSSFNIGNGGSFSELDIVGGSTVTSVYGYLGYGNSSSNNTVLISDPGSLWQASNLYLGQGAGANNLLIVSNSAHVSSGVAALGSGAGRSNMAIVTGAGSVWSNLSGLSVGAYGSNSLFIVTNGGTVTSGTLSGLGTLGASSVSNLAVVTDAGSRWTVNGQFYVGDFSSRNELDILNGGVVADTTGIIGANIGRSNNLAVVTGTGSVWTNVYLTVGSSGSQNTLIITNGGQVYTVNTSYISQNSTASNNAVVISGTGSTLNAGYFYVGYTSPGNNRLTITNGGAFITPNVFDQGVYCNSNLVTLADTNSLLQCGVLRVGYSGTGNQFMISNGATLSVMSTATIEGTSTRVTIAGAGTLWTNSGDLQFGQLTNVLAITSGGTLVNSNGYILSNGGPTPNSNMEIVAGTNSLWKNLGNFHVADTKGQLLITNGGTLLASNSYFGESGTGNNSALVAGLGSLWTNQADLYIGSNGPNNQVTVTDSGVLRARNLTVGNVGNRNQLIVSNAGNVTIRGLAIGTPVNSQSNSVTLSGGTILITNGSASLLQYGALTVNSGTFTTPFIGTDVTGPVGSAIILNGGLFQSAATTYRNPAPFVIGDGTDVTTYEMLYSPSPNAGTHSFPGGVTVSSNALLKGFGTLISSVTVNSGGTIAPGTNIVGAITVQGNLTLNAGSTNVMKLNSPPGLADNLLGITNLIYGGTLQLANIGSALAAGNSFKLFNAKNYFGAFDTVLPASPGAGLRWDTERLKIDGVLRVFAVPTPAPAIGSSVTVDGNLLINTTGGIAYDACYLLTCTNFPPAPADWTCVATNYFDAGGVTSFTNAIPANEPQRYFKVQVN